MHIGLDLGLVEAKQRLPLLNNLAFTDQDAADHATGQGLHRLALAGYHHRALHGDALIERCQGCPGNETAKADQGQQPAQSHVKTRAAAFIYLTHTPPPVANAALAG
ncbi:hypothetical protein D9M71_198820 [compost metagenome]